MWEREKLLRSNLIKWRPKIPNSENNIARCENETKILEMNITDESKLPEINWVNAVKLHLGKPWFQIQLLSVHLLIQSKLSCWHWETNKDGVTNSNLRKHGRLPEEIMLGPYHEQWIVIFISGHKGTLSYGASMVWRSSEPWRLLGIDKLRSEAEETLLDG